MSGLTLATTTIVDTDSDGRPTAVRSPRLVLVDSHPGPDVGMVCHETDTGVMGVMALLEDDLPLIELTPEDEVKD